MRCLPWQKPLYHSLWQRKQQGRLPHALLFTGPHGIGKTHFAKALCQSLLCMQPDMQGSPCGECKNCLLFSSDNHPDYRSVVPDDEGKAIRVDQIRELIQYLGLSRHTGEMRCVIINPADMMNSAAANSLLKTLEEPPPQTLICLVSASPSSLPATIRSRCQLIKIPLPAAHEAIQWLEEQGVAEDTAGILLDLAGGRPLAALSLTELPIRDWHEQILDDLTRLSSGEFSLSRTANSWLKMDIQWPIIWLAKWVEQAIRDRMTQQTSSSLPGPLQEQLEQVDLKKLFAFLDTLLKMRWQINTNANSTLLTESLLIDWLSLFRSGQTGR